MSNDVTVEPMPVILLLGPRSVGGAPDVDPEATWGATTVRAAASMNAVAAGVGATVVVAGPNERDALAAELAEFARIGDRVGALRAASFDVVESLDAALERIAVAGDDAHGAGVLVGWLDQPTAAPSLWRRLGAGAGSVLVAGKRGDRAPLWIGASTWSDARRRGVEPWRVPVANDADGTGRALEIVELDVWAGLQRTPEIDAEYVEACLGRTPQVSYSIAARRSDGRPTVIENPPFLADGRPMPTTFWLIDPELNRRIGTIEAGGGVDRAEADLGLDLLAETHRRYAAYRDSLIPDGYDGHRPSGGVGGTRVGVKCLHTHFAWYLAGGDDPVGAWVQERLGPTKNRE